MTVRKSAAACTAVIVMIGLALAPGTAAAAQRPQTGDSTTAVTDWDATSAAAAVAGCLSPANDPLHESRMYAMSNIAISDALNAIDRRTKPYALAFHVPRWTSAPAAVAAAAHGVLVPLLRELEVDFGSACVDAGVAVVQTAYTAALSAIPAGPARTVGIQAGTRAADAVLTLRSHDGSDTPLQDPNYPQGTTPGAYRFTPGQTFAFGVGWGSVTPFALRSSTQFMPAPPYSVTSKSYAADVNEIQRLGGDGVTTHSARTPKQTETALFWIESAPLSWNRIARSLATSSHLDLWEQARLYGLLNISQADGYIGSFQNKYDYNFWRPVTAIRNADTDGNPLTTVDPTWTPLASTPPIPDYDSAHSVEGAAAAAAFQSFFGTDRYSFTACSLTVPAGSTCNDPRPVLHHFTSFSQAANENGISRILVGFHFRHAVEAGLKDGHETGLWAAAHTLQPIRRTR